MNFNPLDMPENENGSLTTMTPNTNTIEPIAATKPLNPNKYTSKHSKTILLQLQIALNRIIYRLWLIIYSLCLDFGIDWIDRWSLATKFGVSAMLALAVALHTLYTVKEVSIQGKFYKWLRRQCNTFSANMCFQP